MSDLIDVHVHLHTGDRRAETSQQFDAAEKYFGRQDLPRDAAGMAHFYRTLGSRAVIFDVDSETRSGQAISNEEIAAAVQQFPDVFIGFGSVDPWKGEEVTRAEVRRCADLGLRGMKFHPTVQAFRPNDRQFYPLYREVADAGLIALFHSGMTGIGAGTPGGGGIRLDYARPIPYLDDVAVDFPDLTIIAAHPSWPWQEEMLAVARHKSNVYLDLSGWAPKYFPPSLVQHTNTLLRDKVLFGSDYPLIDPRRWLEEFKDLDIRAEVRPKVLGGNASRLLGL